MMNTHQDSEQLETKCTYCGEIKSRFDLSNGSIISCKNPNCFKTTPTNEAFKAEDLGNDIRDLMETAKRLGFGLCIQLLEDAWKSCLVDEGLSRENIMRVMGKR